MHQEHRNGSYIFFSLRGRVTVLVDNLYSEFARIIHLLDLKNKASRIHSSFHKLIFKASNVIKSLIVSVIIKFKIEGKRRKKEEETKILGDDNTKTEN